MADQPQYNRMITTELPFGIELVHFVVDALKGIYKTGYNYKKAGVLAMELPPVASAQRMIFQNSALATHT